MKVYNGYKKQALTNEAVLLAGGGHLKLSEFLYWNSGHLCLKDSDNLIYLINTTNIIPITNNSYDLGSTSKRWNNVYLNKLYVSNNSQVSNLNAHYLNGLTKNDFLRLYAWTAKIRRTLWSTLCTLTGTSAGASGYSFLLLIKGTRNNVVYNNEYIINTHPLKKANITKLVGSNYSNITLRVVTDSNGLNTYVDIKDSNSNNSIDEDLSIWVKLWEIYTTDATISTKTSYTAGLDMSNSTNSSTYTATELSDSADSQHTSFATSGKAFVKDLIISGVSTGTSPLSILSTTKVDNLNSDLLDGYHITDLTGKSGENLIKGTSTASSVGWHTTGWENTNITAADLENGIYYINSISLWNAYYYDLLKITAPISQYLTVTTITNPSGSPNDLWFEKSGNDYVKSSDSSVTSGKTYYSIECNYPISYSFDIMYMSESTGDLARVSVGSRWKYPNGSYNKIIYDSNDTTIVTNADKWVHVQGTLSKLECPYFAIAVINNNSDTSYIRLKIKNLKVELGTLPSIWTPNAYDINHKYWANVPITNSENTTATPQFAKLGINTTVSNDHQLNVNGSIRCTGTLTSTIAGTTSSGNAPFIVSSTKLVDNLNVNYLQGKKVFGMSTDGIIKEGFVNIPVNTALGNYIQIATFANIGANNATFLLYLSLTTHWKHVVLRINLRCNYSTNAVSDHLELIYIVDGNFSSSDIRLCYNKETKLAALYVKDLRNNVAGLSTINTKLLVELRRSTVNTLDALTFVSTLTTWNGTSTLTNYPEYKTPELVVQDLKSISIQAPLFVSNGTNYTTNYLKIATLELAYPGYTLKRFSMIITNRNVYGLLVVRAEVASAETVEPTSGNVTLEMWGSNCINHNHLFGVVTKIPSAAKAGIFRYDIYINANLWNTTTYRVLDFTPGWTFLTELVTLESVGLTSSATNDLRNAALPWSSTNAPGISSSYSALSALKYVGKRHRYLEYNPTSTGTYALVWNDLGLTAGGWGAFFHSGGKLCWKPSESKLTISDIASTPNTTNITPTSISTVGNITASGTVTGTYLTTGGTTHRFKVWKGSASDYTNIATKDSDTLYFII